MGKIRVMHCLGQLNTGGAETLVINVLRNIDREKFQFDFLLFDDEKGFYDDEVKKLGSQLFYTSHIRKVGIKKYLNQMIDFFKKQDIDVVHSHMDWQGGFIAYAAYKAGIHKIVVHSHANQKMYETNAVYKLLIKLNKYLIRKYASDLCACSYEAGESLFGKEKFEIVINGIDMKRYINPDFDKVQELKSKFHIYENDIVLGNIGSFSKNKNQIFLVDILKDLIKINKDYKLILVGDGKLRHDIENDVKSCELQNNIVFTGVQEDIPEILQLFDIFLFPSIFEGLGIVAVEAQAASVPCLVSDSVPKKVTLDPNIIQFIPLDKEIWCENIIRLVDTRNTNKKDINLLDCPFDITHTIHQFVSIYYS